MVFHLSWHEIHTCQVIVKILDASDNLPFNGIAYEQDPTQLDLNVAELEHVGNGASAMGHGYRVLGDKVPRKMWWKGGRQKMPDVIGYQHFAIAPRVRDFIEEIEPGRHQFFPVEVYRSKDGGPVATYYWLNVCARIDCVDEEQSSFEQGIDYSGKPFRKWHVPNRRLVFDPQKAGEHQLWVNPDTYLSGPLCSNAFASLAQGLDISGLTFTAQETAEL